MRALVLVLAAAAVAGGVGSYVLWQKLQEANRRIGVLEADRDAVVREVVRISNDYAAAHKVDRALFGLQGQIDALKRNMAVAAGEADGTHVLELGLHGSGGGNPEIVLRYTGDSFKEALARKTLTRPSRTLAAAVQPDAKDPRFGTVTITYGAARYPNGSRSGGVGSGGGARLAVYRSSADGVDWDLTAEAREEVRRLMGLGD